MDGKRSLEDVKAEFVGKPYSKEAARLINKEGFGFTTSFATGKIHEVYIPVKPRATCRT
jgi:hypothetical protein